jgi:hypothetical protein
MPNSTPGLPINYCLQLFDVVCPKASNQSSSATVTITVDACNANYDSALGLMRVDQQKQIGRCLAVRLRQHLSHMLSAILFIA